jgi:hypothetical protein
MGTPRAALAGFVCALLAGCSGVDSHSVDVAGTSDAPMSAGATLSALVRGPYCPAPERPAPVLALTPSGVVDALDPTTLGVEAAVARAAMPRLGIAVRPEMDVAFVAARGPDERPAVWAVPIRDCRAEPTLVERDAELPSVSPDGGYLGFVTLDGRGRQTGVAVVSIGAGGHPLGLARQYRATSIPPRLPIAGVAVGRDDAVVAVWGGFVDSYLGATRVTVGTLDPATATSLGTLMPVFDAEGISVPIIQGKATAKPEDWQAVPVYLPNGDFLVNDHSTDISMPFTDTTPGVSGGGIRDIVRNVGSIVSLAVGKDGSLVFIGHGGRLTMALDAVDLPFGPAASSPPSSAPRESTASGHFTAVAWTEGPGAEDTGLPAVYHMIAHLPDVVDMSEPAAGALLNGLGLPVFVAKTVNDPAVAADTVLAQDPAAGDGVACQCSVGLTVSGP